MIFKVILITLAYFLLTLAYFLPLLSIILYEKDKNEGE